MSEQSGAKFYKADLHIHTPGSLDFADSKASAEDVLQAATNAGIDILAVTDHNSASWIDDMRKVSLGKPITIIPGVEITTPEGHILGLFDTAIDASLIEDLLIKIGIPREKHGREEAISSQHAEAVVQEISKIGGIAIAAHANENCGILKAKGQYKLQLVPMVEISALELTKQEEIERFCAGKISHDYKPKACSQSSDAHRLVEFGRRITYLKMQNVSLEGIRQAFLDYQVRVRFPWNYVEPKHPRIRSLTVNQGFFAGQTFRFHESLNCLVGGQGTGKSTVIELLRHCFGNYSSFENIQEDHEGKLSSLVGDGGNISIEYIDSDGELKIVRREVQPWDTLPEIKDSTGNFVSLESRPSFFSQGELVQVASNRLAQLEIIDRRLDLSQENENEQQLLQNLSSNASRLAKSLERIQLLRAEVESPEHGKEITEIQHKKLEQQLQHPVLKEFPVWEAEQKFVRKIGQALGNLPETFGQQLSSIDLEDLSIDPPDNSPNRALLSPLLEFNQKIQTAFDAAKTNFSKFIQELEAEVASATAKWRTLFEAKKAEHDEILEKLGQTDIRKANAQFRNLNTSVL